MHDREALLARLGWSRQRIAPHEVDVVGDEHQGAGAERPSHAARRVRDNQDLDAELGEDAHREGSDGGGMAFI